MVCNRSCRPMGGYWRVFCVKRLDNVIRRTASDRGFIAQNRAERRHSTRPTRAHAHERTALVSSRSVDGMLAPSGTPALPWWPTGSVPRVAVARGSAGRSVGERDLAGAEARTARIGGRWRRPASRFASGRWGCSRLAAGEASTRRSAASTASTRLAIRESAGVPLVVRGAGRRALLKATTQHGSTEEDKGHQAPGSYPDCDSEHADAGRAALGYRGRGSP